MVNRYTFQDDEVGMEIDEDGYWMAYDDYEALEAKLTALVEAFDIAEGEHPLSCEYADDARYTWPDRWSILKAAIAAAKVTP